MNQLARPVCLIALTIVALALLPGLVAAQDLSGTWDVTADTAPADRGVLIGCSFAGTADVAQDGSDLFGTASMDLVTGDQSCPAEMSASLTGSVDGTAVNVQLNDAQLGSANFDGTSSGPNVGGSMSVASGPFTGYAGTFSATVRGTASAIPTLSNVAILAFALLLASLGLLRARDRRRAI